LAYGKAASIGGLFIPNVTIVKGFGCRPLTDGAASTGGRRPKASKGGNRA